MIYNKNQTGQSLAEFVVSAGVICSFLVIIPMIGKLGYLKLKANSAADYVAWRSEKGIDVGNSSEISREVGQRFFARTGADVLSDRNAECDDIEDTDHYGNSLINWRAVEAHSKKKHESSDVMKTGRDKFGMFKDSYQRQISITAPVNNQTPFEEIPSFIEIKSDAVILTNAFTSKGTESTKKIIKDTNILKMYEDGQSETYRLINAGMSLLGEDGVDAEEIYDQGKVPEDRIEEFF